MTSNHNYVFLSFATVNLLCILLKHEVFDPSWSPMSLMVMTLLRGPSFVEWYLILQVPEWENLFIQNGMNCL